MSSFHASLFVCFVFFRSLSLSPPPFFSLFSLSFSLLFFFPFSRLCVSFCVAAKLWKSRLSAAEENLRQPIGLSNCPLWSASTLSLSLSLSLSLLFSSSLPSSPSSFSSSPILSHHSIHLPLSLLLSRDNQIAIQYETHLV